MSGVKFLLRVWTKSSSQKIWQKFKKSFPKKKKTKKDNDFEV